MALEQGALHRPGGTGGQPCLPLGWLDSGWSPGLQVKVLGGPVPVLILQCHCSVVFPSFRFSWTRVLCGVVTTHRKGMWPGPDQAGVMLCFHPETALICFRSGTIFSSSLFACGGGAHRGEVNAQ